MRMYPNASRVNERKKRIYEIGAAARNFGVMSVDYEQYEEVKIAKGRHIRENSKNLRRKEI